MPHDTGVEKNSLLPVGLAASPQACSSSIRVPTEDQLFDRLPGPVAVLDKLPAGSAKNIASPDESHVVAAIHRVVAIVAQYKVAVGRHDEYRRVVFCAIGNAIKNKLPMPTRQELGKLRYPARRSAATIFQKISYPALI